MEYEYGEKKGEKRGFWTMEGFIYPQRQEVRTDQGFRAVTVTFGQK